MEKVNCNVSPVLSTGSGRISDRAVLVPSEFLVASRQAGFPRVARVKLCPSLRPVCPEHGVLQVLWGVGVVPFGAVCKGGGCQEEWS